jgi:hypothetical protein
VLRRNDGPAHVQTDQRAKSSPPGEVNVERGAEAITGVDWERRCDRAAADADDIAEVAVVAGVAGAGMRHGSISASWVGGSSLIRPRAGPWSRADGAFVELQARLPKRRISQSVYGSGALPRSSTRELCKSP